MITASAETTVSPSGSSYGAGASLASGFPATGSLSLPSNFLQSLRLGFRQQVFSSDTASSQAAVNMIRDAGYAAGVALFEHFALWLAEEGEADPASVSDERFPWLLEAFLHRQGWGHAELSALSEAVMALDVSEWGETRLDEGPDAPGSASGEPLPGCLVTTGLLSGFFTCLAEAPIAVLEVEAPVAGAGRSRFLLGSADVLEYIWEAMQRGIPYDRAAASA